MREKLIELEEKLKHHSHDQTAIEIVQEFAKSLGKTRNKQVVLVRMVFFYVNHQLLIKK